MNEKIINSGTALDSLSLRSAYFGGGCFWCFEAQFRMLEGVKSVISGYAGGKLTDPSYEEVCGGRSGHAELVKIEYHPSHISYKSLLQYFFSFHDATTLNRQGNDVGTQYRSVIFYTTEEEKLLALQQKDLEQQKISALVVTEVSPLDIFYAAEEYHQKYYEQNPGNGYCAMVIRPKIEKLKAGLAIKERK